MWLFLGSCYTRKSHKTKIRKIHKVSYERAITRRVILVQGKKRAHCFGGAGADAGIRLVSGTDEQMVGWGDATLVGEGAMM